MAIMRNKYSCTKKCFVDYKINAVHFISHLAKFLEGGHCD